MSKYQLIKEKCRRKGITISGLERELGFARGSISKIDQHTPSLSRVIKICDYLDIPPVELLPEKLASEHEDAVSGLNASDSRKFAFNEEDSRLVVSDNAMYPTLHKGDLLNIHKQSETLPEDITVLKIGDTYAVRYVEYARDGVWLKSENKDYPDQYASVQDIMSLPIVIIGKAVAFQRKL